MTYKKTYKIQGMDCDSCAKMIELDLEDAGFSAKCDYAKETLEVDISQKDDEEKVSNVVHSSGYQLTQVLN